MESRRKNRRSSHQQDVVLFLYDKSNKSQLTVGVPALLLNLSKHGAGLKCSQVLIDGNHLFYAALDSDTIFLNIVFRPLADTDEEIMTLLARPVWLNRDMEDRDMPFSMGVQFVD